MTPNELAVLMLSKRNAYLCGNLVRLENFYKEVIGKWTRMAEKYDGAVPLEDYFLRVALPENLLFKEVKEFFEKRYLDIHHVDLDEEDPTFYIGVRLRYVGRIQ
jgi:hypothetical protein